jgi:hypothetical protein
MTEFQKYPSIPRYRKDISITEKIDGTNACVIIEEDGTIFAQSRKRIITPEDDNFGFAAWVHAHADTLAILLGPGYHYGEWWGSGIQRGYGLTKGEKHFTVFNPTRYDLEGQDLVTAVPVLYTGPAYLPVMAADGHTRDAVEYTMSWLKTNGSQVPFATGFDNPEGIIVFHTASQSLYKVTYEYDEGKWSKDKA